MLRIPRIAIAIGIIPLVSATAASAQEIGFQKQTGSLVITVDDDPIATYVYQDDKVPRPYFAHVKAPSGQQVTRNFPPIPGQDPTDHETMHPGIWMAFGDLDGSDSWRNKANIVHERFAVDPRGGAAGRGCFVEQKTYQRDDGSTVCRERFAFAIEVRDDGYLLIWDSTFDADEMFYFGDQEEMGLGFRVATPLTEKNGGRLADSEGRIGADAIWSQAARWCDYSGTIDGRRLGMTLLCHRDNFGPFWMHARDYGFCAANPFGRKAMNKGETSRIEIAPGEKLRLRYGIWVHSNESATAPTAEELNDVYDHYLAVADKTPCQ